MEFTVTAGLLMTDTATTNTFPLATLLEKETEREGVALQPAKPDSSKQKAEFCWTRDDGVDGQRLHEQQEREQAHQ